MKPLNVHQSIIDKSHMHASTKVRPDYVAPLRNTTTSYKQCHGTSLTTDPPYTLAPYLPRNAQCMWERSHASHADACTHKSVVNTTAGHQVSSQHTSSSSLLAIQYLMTANGKKVHNVLHSNYTVTLEIFVPEKSNPSRMLSASRAVIPCPFGGISQTSIPL